MKPIKRIIRVFEDGTSESLEGASLKNYVEQERASLSLLLTHGYKGTGKPITWKPINTADILDQANRIVSGMSTEPDPLHFAMHHRAAADLLPYLITALQSKSRKR